MAKKPGLVLAIGMKPKAEKKDDVVNDESDFDAAASAAFDAIKEDDIEGFKLAFKAMHEACMNGESDDEVVE